MSEDGIRIEKQAIGDVIATQGAYEDNRVVELLVK